MSIRDLHRVSPSGPPLSRQVDLVVETTEGFSDPDAEEVVVAVVGAQVTDIVVFNQTSSDPAGPGLGTGGCWVSAAGQVTVVVTNSGAGPGGSTVNGTLEIRRYDV